MDSQKKYARVNTSLNGQRLDRVVSQLFPELSRSAAQRHIDCGRVMVDGNIEISRRVKTAAGQSVELLLLSPEPTDILPEQTNLAVLYEDRDVIVINKPPGMSVHPAGGLRSGTLVNALLALCTDLSGVGGVLRPGIVHRLDKDTSGCIIAAKNDRAHEFISAQFRKRTVEKEYIALCFTAKPLRSRVIDIPIARHPVHRKRFTASDTLARARDAVSRVYIQAAASQVSLVRVKPETGRTHQIRVHCASIGAPIIGDSLYGTKSSTLFSKNMGVQRQMLHAYTLELTLPSGERKKFMAEIPEDMLGLMTRTGIDGIDN